MNVGSYEKIVVVSQIGQTNFNKSIYNKINIKTKRPIVPNFNERKIPDVHQNNFFNQNFFFIVVGNLLKMLHLDRYQR